MYRKTQNKRSSYRREDLVDDEIVKQKLLGYWTYSASIGTVLVMLRPPPILNNKNKKSLGPLTSLMILHG